MRPGFKLCYLDQLARDRHAAGIVKLSVRVGCDGSVVSIDTSQAGIDTTTVDCMIEVIRVARFKPPAGGFAVIAVPVPFVNASN